MTLSTLSRRFVLIAAVVGAVTLLTPAAVSAQGFKWWQSEMFKRELGLTTDQSAKIEAIFQKTVPVLRQEKDALDRAQADFKSDDRGKRRCAGDGAGRCRRSRPL